MAFECDSQTLSTVGGNKGSHLDPGVGSGCKGKWGKSLKEEEIAWRIHADRGWEGLNETIYNVFWVLDLSARKDGENEKELRFHEFCPQHP